MTEAPKRIGICPIHKTWHRDPHETDWNYIRADLVEAKLAKAVEALREIAAAFGCECGDAARATLGDIEGDER